MGVAQDGGFGVRCPTATIPENLAVLGPRVRTLFDFIEIWKCPPVKMNDIEDFAICVRAPGKSTNDGVGNLNSSTLGVIGVVCRRRRKRWRR